MGNPSYSMVELGVITSWLMCQAWCHLDGGQSGRALGEGKGVVYLSKKYCVDIQFIGRNCVWRQGLDRKPLWRRGF